MSILTTCVGEATIKTDHASQTKVDSELKPQSADTNMTLVGEHNEL